MSIMKLTKWQHNLLLHLLMCYLKEQQAKRKELEQEEEDDMGDGARWAHNDYYCVVDNNIQAAIELIRLLDGQE